MYRRVRDANLRTPLRRNICAASGQLVIMIVNTVVASFSTAFILIAIAKVAVAVMVVVAVAAAVWS